MVSLSTFKARVFNQPQTVHFSFHMMSYFSTCPLSLFGLSFLSVGWPHYLCSTSEKCTVATGAALQIHLSLFASVCALMYIVNVYSVQPLLPSLCICISVHLMLNFDPSPSFCSYFPWHKSIYLYVPSVFPSTLDCCCWYSHRQYGHFLLLSISIFIVIQWHTTKQMDFCFY